MQLMTKKQSIKPNELFAGVRILSLRLHSAPGGS